MDPVGEALHVLVVDDDPDMQEVLTYQVERLGYAVVCAGSTDDALPQLGSVDVVMSDLHLGGETCERLLRSCAEAGVPAVIVTASPAAAADLARTVPRTQVLGKPVSLTNIASALGAAR
ncbi:MAG: response regulator [Candidatus Nanopelagicales bacterium]